MCTCLHLIARSGGSVPICVLDAVISAVDVHQFSSDMSLACWWRPVCLMQDGREWRDGNGATGTDSARTAGVWTGNGSRIDDSNDLATVMHLGARLPARDTSVELDGTAIPLLIGAHVPACGGRQQDQ
jgi:hypothetical protein